MKKLHLFFIISCVLCFSFTYSCSSKHQSKSDKIEQAKKIKEIVDSLTDVKEIFSTEFAFAALKNDGSVLTWGDDEYGGDSSAVADQLSSEVVKIVSSGKAFAAIKSNGSVVTWGNARYGGNSSKVADKLSSGVIKIVATKDWGSSGDTINLSKTEDNKTTFALSSCEKAVYDYGAAFAALKSDNTAVSWGSSERGAKSDKILTDIADIISTTETLVALKTDGTITSWDNEISNPIKSKDSEIKITKLYPAYNTFIMEASNGKFLTYPFRTIHLHSGIKKIVSGTYGFAILETDGSVLTSTLDSNRYDRDLISKDLGISGVVDIASTDSGGFAAIKSDGSVVTWGEKSFGGDSSTVASQLSSGVVSIVSNSRAFAALKSDGSVVTWGSSYGGDSSSVSSYLSSGVTNIVSTERAFAALKSDGSVVTWGYDEYGGNSNLLKYGYGKKDEAIPVNTPLTNVKSIYSSNAAFAALKNDGTVVCWGGFY